MGRQQTRKDLEDRIRALEEKIVERDSELEATNLEMAMGISEVFDGLKEISAGNPEVRISETSGLELMSKLKNMVNITGQNLAEIVNLSHEFAMGLAEHFDVLDRVSKGDLTARVAGISEVELLEFLKGMTNQMIGSVSAEITERRQAQQALQEAHQELERRVEQRTWELAKANEQLKREIKERKKTEHELRESEAKYSTLVEDSQTGIYIDQDERIVFANDTFAQMYKYPKDELVGIESWKLAHPDDREFTNEMRGRRLRGEPVTVDYEAKGLTRDGETIWIRRRNTLIEYNGKPGILGNVVDISAQMRVEQELRKRNEELNSFVHVVSHDLKTPIIAVQGFSSRLSQQFEEQLGEKGRKYLTQIETSAQRMERLVSDLLALSRLGRVACSFEKIPSWGIIRNVTAALRPKFKEKGIRLTLGDDFPIVLCDGDRIHQVFDNLVVNAIKHLGETEDPEIEIGHEDGGTSQRFFVKDNGRGIDPKYHQKIFEMFERLAQTEDKQGTGLGLAIVEKIVESHGGKVWVESSKGKGATFYFTLPKTTAS